MWSDLPSPIIIAHRGDKAYAPENTISAFKQAAEKGARAIEFDTQLTADGQIVILHDQTVNRTTDGTGNVAKLSLSAIRDLNAGVNLPGQFKNEKIPTLSEVFEEVGNLLYMNIELKNYSTPFDGLVDKVVDLVRKYGMQDRVLFSSFLSCNLRKASSLIPETPRGLLTMRGKKGLWGRKIGWRGNYLALHPYFTDVDSLMIKRVHKYGKRVNVWTVNSEEDIKRMILLGADGIITDDPGQAFRLLGRGN
jgi:glycerophosphoryl diester phosphodiesterase